MSARSTGEPQKILVSQITRTQSAVRSTNPCETTTQSCGILKPLRPVGAVEGAVLDGFARVFGREGRGALEVGDGARNFQDAIVSAGGKAEALGGGLRDFFAFGGDGAMFADELRRHLRIGVDVFFGGGDTVRAGYRERAARDCARRRSFQSS